MRAGAALALAPLPLLAGACRRAPPPAGARECLLVTVDTLRDDFVSAYGSGLGATPHLDRLAAEGALFENHYAVVSHTCPSHATLFSGLFPREHGLLANGERLAEDLPWLPQALAEAGYRTGAAIGARVLESRFGWGRGFEWFDEDVAAGPGPPAARVHERYASAVVERALGFLERDDGRPVFLWLHVYDPHHPYQARLPDLRTAGQRESAYGRHVEESELYGRRALVDMLAGYDAEVRGTDADLARLFAAWRARPNSDVSLVCLTSDHGEGLGEHGYGSHGFYLYEEQLRVPLILRAPSALPAGARVAALTSAADLPATLLDLLGVAAPEGLGGASFAALATAAARAGGVVPAVPARAAWAERRIFDAADFERRGELVRLLERRDRRAGGAKGEMVVLIEDGWKYVWSEDVEDELYDLTADPAEAHNVLAGEPERAARMAERVDAWRAARPLRDRRADVDASALEMLDDLGY